MPLSAKPLPGPSRPAHRWLRKPRLLRLSRQCRQRLLLLLLLRPLLLLLLLLLLPWLQHLRQCKLLQRLWKLPRHRCKRRQRRLLLPLRLQLLQHQPRHRSPSRHR